MTCTPFMQTQHALRRTHLADAQGSAPPHADDPYPDVLPEHCRVLGFAGRGAFSDVWHVRTADSGESCALKLLRAEHRRDPAALQTFRHEAAVAAQTAGVFVIRTLRFGEERGVPFQLQEWLAGTPLEALLLKTGRLPTGQAVWIARQSACGLRELKKTGFSHGDLKPANIFLCADGSVKLIDLGFARPLVPGSGARREAVLVGTPDYLAPEALAAAPADPVVQDVYSLGVVLYRMLTGRLPFAAELPAEVLRHQRQTPAPALRRQCPHAPRQLGELVGRLLSKQPLRRMDSLEALIDELVRLELMTLADRFLPG